MSTKTIIHPSPLIERHEYPHWFVLVVLQCDFRHGIEIMWLFDLNVSPIATAYYVILIY